MKNKKETLDKLNEHIDRLIMQGRDDSAHYKKLCRIHYQLTHN
jgi:hypothetical protein